MPGKTGNFFSSTDISSPEMNTSNLECNQIKVIYPRSEHLVLCSAAVVKMSETSVISLITYFFFQFQMYEITDPQRVSAMSNILSKTKKVVTNQS